MRQKPYTAVFVLFLLAVASCNPNKPKSLQEKSLFDIIDFEILNKALSQQLTSISDSGTLQTQYLNFPDSIKTVFSYTEFSEKWAKKLLIKQLLKTIVISGRNAEFHGLNPDYYHHSILLKYQNEIIQSRYDSIKVVDYKKLSMAIVLSLDACMGLYHDLRCGRVDPGYTGSVDLLPRRKCGNLLGLVLNDSTEKALIASFPDFEPYNKLQKEYKRLFSFNDRMDSKTLLLTDDKVIKPGDTVSNYLLREVARKLHLLGYRNWPDSVLNNQAIYNADFSKTIMQFQVERGLVENGTLEKETIAQLNVSRKTMMVRLKATMERWRWMGPVGEQTKVWANIAENRVYAWKQDTLKTDMNICSGTNRNAEYYRKLLNSQKKGSTMLPPDNLETPLLKASITHFVVNPTWFVPHLIAIKEILPEIKSNPGSLARYNYILRNRSGDIVNPYAIDWSRISPRNFPFSIEQLSGSQNSLGKVVIHFPNSYSIFMHDTNYKWVFGLEDRHVSHGCIRLEKPFEMIEFIHSFGEKNKMDDVYIAAGMEPKNDKKLIKEWHKSKGDSIPNRMFKMQENKYFKAALKIPIYIIYHTCFVTIHGAIKYTNDAYKRDEKMMKEMDLPSKKRYKSPVKIIAPKELVAAP